MVEKEINGKKYSYMNGSNVLITRILADISGYQTKFNDIAASTAKEDIMRLEKAGIVKGTTPTTYEPNRAITRAEFLAIAMGAFGYDLYVPAKSLPFTDVDSSSWQARVISAALENNVIYGDTNASGARVFRPNSQITKVEALAIVYKLSGIEVKDAKMHSFTDAAAAWQNTLLSNPELACFDEPSNGLDIYYEEKLIQIISNYIKNDSNKIIISSHDINFLYKVVDNFIVINKGEIIGEFLKNNLSLEEVTAKYLELLEVKK